MPGGMRGRTRVGSIHPVRAERRGEERVAASIPQYPQYPLYEEVRLSLFLPGGDHPSLQTAQENPGAEPHLPDAYTV